MTYRWRIVMCLYDIYICFIDLELPPITFVAYISMSLLKMVILRRLMERECMYSGWCSSQRRKCVYKFLTQCATTMYGASPLNLLNAVSALTPGRTLDGPPQLLPLSRTETQPLPLPNQKRITFELF